MALLRCTSRDRVRGARVDGVSRRVVTAAVQEMAFAMPVKIGDTLCVYTEISRVGRTSMTLKVETWAQRYLTHVMEKVTEATFVMVALDAEGKPTPVPSA